MVILHLLAPTTAGGLERVVHSLALGQQARGHQVAVAAVLDAEVEGHPFFPPLLRAGIPVHRLIVPPRAYGEERQAIAALVQALKPDVVHSHGYRTDVVDGGVIRRLGVATVATAHGFTTGSLKNRLYEFIQRRALRRFDGVIAVSQQLWDELGRAGVPAARLHLVPNAWTEIVEPMDRSDARAALGLAPDGFVIGWVGRMSREKGLEILVEALKDLGDLPLTLCAIGAGTERLPVEARARQLGVADRIHWPGLVAEAARYFRAFDVFALSSRTEGIPIALLEAIAADVPVVATRVGGVPTVVDESQALLVEPERPAALADAIRRVHDDPPAASMRVRAARGRLLASFAPDAWLERHEEVYRSAMLIKPLAKIMNPAAWTNRA
jgi:glycosyltransferase involved in cell wall biosynthesis